MNLLNLAPGIQEALLFLEVDDSGARYFVRDLQLVAAKLAWRNQ